MMWFLPWFVWAIIGPCSAYFWGRSIGAYRMRRAILRHPSLARQDSGNRIRRAA
jgi:hypothetical protein